MKLGIFGDIHGNSVALKAVLEALDEAGVDQLFCTGDVVGYGPNPQECIELLAERQIPSAMGNHDYYVINFGRSQTRIHQDARTSLEWTQSILPRSCFEWLFQLPRMLTAEGLQIIHSTHVLKPRWRYVVSPQAAAESFMFQSSQISFNGHTHIPLVATHRSGCPVRVTYLRSGRLRESWQSLVGVGSVGQPRDGDPRAAAVIYDSEIRDVRLLRIPYDIDAVKVAIADAGLPSSLAERLEQGH